MKNITTLLLLFLCTSLSLAQQVEKNYPLANTEKLSLKFEYPELVKVSTWDKQEVQIVAKVLINGQDGSEDFVLSPTRNSGQLTISSELKNLDSYKQNYVSVQSDSDEDESIIVSTDGSTYKIGKGSKTYYNGTEIEVLLEVFLPENAHVEIDAKYGMVEVLSAPKQLNVHAKYGGADIKIKESALKNLYASTSWGQIFSNLSSKVSVAGDDMLGKSLVAEIDNASGVNSVKVQSEYGNVFLRKN